MTRITGVWHNHINYFKNQFLYTITIISDISLSNSDITDLQYNDLEKSDKVKHVTYRNLDNCYLSIFI